MAKRKFIYNATELIESVPFDTVVADDNGNEILTKITDVITKLDTRVDSINPSASKNDIINSLQDTRNAVKALLESLETDVNNKVNITYTTQDTFIGTAAQAKKWFDAEGIDYSGWNNDLTERLTP